MAKERKRVERKELNKLIPKVRPEPPIEEPKKRKNKGEEPKFIRVAQNSGIEKFKEMSLRVQKGELKMGYYAIDGNMGYFHYEKLLN